MDEAPLTADGEEKQANKLKTGALTFLPLPDSNFLGKISNLYTLAARTRSRRRWARLPTLNTSLYARFPPISTFNFMCFHFICAYDFVAKKI